MFKRCPSAAAQHPCVLCVRPAAAARRGETNFGSQQPPPPPDRSSAIYTHTLDVYAYMEACTHANSKLFGFCSRFYGFSFACCLKDGNFHILNEYWVKVFTLLLGERLFNFWLGLTFWPFSSKVKKDIDDARVNFRRSTTAIHWNLIKNSK